MVIDFTLNSLNLQYEFWNELFSLIDLFCISSKSLIEVKSYRDGENTNIMKYERTGSTDVKSEVPVGLRAYNKNF